MSASDAVSVRRRFTATPDSVKQARGWVAEVVATMGYATVAATVELLVSELASNAIRHGKGDHFIVEIDAHVHLVVAVCDPSPVMPRVRQANPSDVSGRGLAIVDQLATQWGVKRHRTGKCLWFTLDNPLARN